MAQNTRPDFVTVCQQYQTAKNYLKQTLGLTDDKLDHFVASFLGAQPEPNAPTKPKATKGVVKSAPVAGKGVRKWHSPTRDRIIEVFRTNNNAPLSVGGIAAAFGEKLCAELGGDVRAKISGALASGKSYFKRYGKAPQCTYTLRSNILQGDAPVKATKIIAGKLSAATLVHTVIREDGASKDGKALNTDMILDGIRGRKYPAPKRQNIHNLLSTRKDLFKRVYPGYYTVAETN